jgi:alkaline phosphatase D
VSLSRRKFLWSAAASVGSLRAAEGRARWTWPDLQQAQAADAGTTGLFQHGVASGDPLVDRVMLWTRVTPRDPRGSAPVEVRWRIGTDPAVTSATTQGSARAVGERDFTVKVDAGGLEPGRPYYYVFESGGERSPIGRTRTLPADDVERIRLASVCCSNYASGYFNVYRCLANRDDLDAVVHLGDYIYEFQDGVPAEGHGFLRLPEPRKEATTLSDYRIRYATHRADPDLQEAHRQHPFIAVWDDHEITNDAWSGGASNHNPESGEGDWATRKAAAYRAYLEWMPVREFADTGIRLYRTFRFGALADLIMLDTRGLRDRQVSSNDVPGLASPTRSILGTDQEAWLFDRLRASQRAGTAWRVIGQQVMFSRLTPPGQGVLVADTWDGYQASRDRVLDVLAAENVRDVAILSGDLHSSWTFDVTKNPWNGYQAESGAGSLAVELVAPAISSDPLFAGPGLRERAPLLRALQPHLKFLDGDNRGYVIVEITPSALRGEWHFVRTVRERSTDERLAAAFVCERGSAHFEIAD